MLRQCWLCYLKIYKRQKQHSINKLQMMEAQPTNHSYYQVMTKCKAYHSHLKVSNELYLTKIAICPNSKGQRNCILEILNSMIIIFKMISYLNHLGKHSHKRNYFHWNQCIKSLFINYLVQTSY